MRLSRIMLARWDFWIWRSMRRAARSVRRWPLPNDDSLSLHKNQRGVSRKPFESSRLGRKRGPAGSPAFWQAPHHAEGHLLAARTESWTDHSDLQYRDTARGGRKRPSATALGCRQGRLSRYCRERRWRDFRLP